MVEDLRLSAPGLAELVGVSTSTAYRWLAAGTAPRSVGLSLFWLTRWGAHTLDAELFNRATVYQGLAEAMSRELWALQEQIARMGQIGQFGSANDPGAHVVRRFGLDCAGTLSGLTTTDHAAVITAGTGSRLIRAER